MRRAIVATVATVVGLVVLLDYRASAPIGQSGVVVRGGATVPSAPSTSAPGATTGSGTTGSGTTGSGTAGSGTAGPTPTTAAPAGPVSYTGADVPYRYGDIQVRITVAGGRITAISTPQESASDPRSESINSQAIPILTKEALAAQGLRFDVVSGATFTSDAFAQALQSALDEAGR